MIEIAILVIVAGCFVGVTGRIWIKWLEKLREAQDIGTVIKFDHKFIISAILAFIAALTPMAAIVPIVIEQLEPSSTTLSLPILFIVSVALAERINNATNKSAEVVLHAGEQTRLTLTGKRTK